MLQVYSLDDPPLPPRARDSRPRLPRIEDSPLAQQASPRRWEWLLPALVLFLAQAALYFFVEANHHRRQSEIWEDQFRDMSSRAMEWCRQFSNEADNAEARRQIIVLLADRLHKAGVAQSDLQSALDAWRAEHESLRAQSIQSSQQWAVFSAGLTEALRVTEAERHQEQQDHAFQQAQTQASLAATGQKLQDATQENAFLTRSAQGLSFDLGHAESRIRCLESDLSSAQSARDRAESEASSLRSEVSCLQSRVSSLESLVNCQRH